jgi:putative spermidine/putrescine transport system ATP-binding protein
MNIPYESFVKFDHVEKSYDGKTLVVQDLSLDVKAGEFLTLLGPSGSGKTTALMMLAGFENPTAGKIYLNGNSIVHVAPEHRNIGMVFQNYALFPHMTVAENIGFPLKVRGISSSNATDKIAAVLSKVGLTGFENRRPSQLSGGQQQRVAVARALVFDPQLVLMDEPLSSLDKQLREQLQYEIKNLHRTTGITFVYVTHDQTEAMCMSDRVAVFHQGRIQQIGTPSQLYESPANMFVAQFIGENNIIKSFNNLHNICVRPERVQINPVDAVDILVNGTVLDVTYLGRYIRVQLDSCGLDNFTVTLANTGQLLNLQVRSMVKLGWNSADCRTCAPLE